MSTLNKGDINWGDWGIYSYEKFLSDFSASQEFMRTSMRGYRSHHQAIEDFLSDNPSPIDSVTPGLGFALWEFAKRRVPHRLEDITNQASLYNPSRDNREGARPSVPKQGPDIFKFILEGDENKGHAIVTEFDQEIDTQPDDLFSDTVYSRRLNEADAHAVSIINKFPAYVRIMDDKLVRLLEKIGFISHNKFADGKLSTLKSIPFGLNFVSFPFNYSESLSTLPVYDLYSTMKTTQRALRRGFKAAENPDPVYDVFFNIGVLAGGTLPRIHMQTYFRTKKDSEETYDYPSEGRTSLKYFGENETIKLEPSNRSWQAYAPSVRGGKFDIRFELKHEMQKDFVNLTDFELWDLAEMLVYCSNILDATIGIPERNIQFFPSGVIIRPFAVDGGHEKIRNERIYGQSAYQFGREYNKANVRIPIDVLYGKPQDQRGDNNFKELVDEESLILKKLRKDA